MAPHPDDECIGVGGVIALYPKQCHIVVMTDGRYGDAQITPKQMQNIRENEFKRAMEYACVDSYIMYGIEDGTLILCDRCFDQVDFSEYSFVFLPNPDDNHSDHTAAYKYAIDAIKKQHIKNIRVFQYEVHKPLAEVTCYLDISCVIEKKQKMLKYHSSQMKIHPYEQQVKSLAGYRGYQNECPEQYLEVYREVDITDTNMLSTGTEIELAKYKKFTNILQKWILIQGYSKIAEYLLKRGYSNIAIYGYGLLGKLLYKELQKSACNIDYVIDKNELLKQDETCIFHETNNLPQADIVVVTTINFFEEIAKELWDNNRLRSIGIEDILEDLDRRMK